MKNIFVILCLLLLPSAAYAQKTKSALTTEVNTNFASGTAITAALLRSTVLDIIGSYYDLNGGSSLSCAAHNWVSALPTLSSITCTQPAIADVSGFGTGVATALGNPVNAAAGLVTFSGAFGTPTSLVLTNSTGLPIAGVTGWGTGVAAALANATNAAGGLLTFSGAFGTPTSLVLTNSTGLPTTSLTGALQATQEPAHTGDMTNTAGSLATTVLKTNGVAFTAGATAAAGQLPGTATNDNATAGNVGEYIEGSLAQASATSLSTGSAKTIASITLSAGDWDVTGIAGLTIASATNIAFAQVSFSTTTNTTDTTLQRYFQQSYGASGTVFGTINNYTIPLHTTRFSVSGSTTVFLVEQVNFTISTLSGFGIIRARRVR